MIVNELSYRIILNFLATKCPIASFLTTGVITWGLPSLDGPDVSISLAIGQNNHKFAKNLTYTCQMLFNFGGNCKEKQEEALENTKNASKTLARANICGNYFNMLLEKTAKFFILK